MISNKVQDMFFRNACHYLGKDTSKKLCSFRKSINQLLTANKTTGIKSS